MTTRAELDRLMQFGSTYQNSCKIDLQSLIEDQSEERERKANIFYELFLEDYNGDLIDVPVLLRNYIDENGNQPNAEGLDQSGWRLTRRFFFYDTVSGIEGDYSSGDQISSVIRYPQSITLKVTLDFDHEEMIYSPLLIITYRERTTTVIE